ncbi:FKBP-type peptidyl-prolyl cis-trans isomerase [Microbacterium sp. BWT-B31]|uniref:FKBP-type peptidyl-prolyl cis-trans isomerase n=1 Tax=Microbacterium sp. BWT-B31 TaxID=3232072 RepID=UPI0035294CBF
MRKIPVVVLSVIALAAASLTGCSASGSAACPRPAADPAVMDLITVTGDTDATPKVKVYTPFHTDDLQVEEVVAGDGNVITTSAQVAVLDVSLVSATTGERIVSTPYDGDLSRAVQISRWEQTFPQIGDIVQCAAEGSRIVAALPPGGIAPEAAPSLGVAGNDSAIVVVDVRKVHLARADGADQFNSDRGVPTVVRAPDGRPGVIIPDGAPPSDLVVQTIKKGDGEPLTADSLVRMHYTGITWADREVFHTTWDSEPASTTFDALVPGLAQALQGKTVGSQILVVVPPDLGYGDRGASGVEPGSTLVFVVDILGIDVRPAS